MFGLFITFWVVVIVVYLQGQSFLQTRRKIIELRDLFCYKGKLSLKKDIVNSDDGYDNREIPRLDVSSEPGKQFKKILERTNEYLYKNIGTSADLNLLEDICDGQVAALEEEIHNTLNVPLYLGLGGTFIGIITGLFGINLHQLIGTDTEMTSLQYLFYGIAMAMCASFLGLGLTVFNSAFSYKEASSNANSGKQDYLNFLRRELMPTLSSSMASSLNSLRSVLGHFVDKFGRNLDAYASSADLLNDNLEKQHLVLQEINKLSLTKTANKIAESFLQLKSSSDSLSVFQTYQNQLNSTISSMSGAVTQIQNLLSKFDEFSSGLALVVSNQNRASELQREFQEAITTHFPTGSEGRDVWRKEFDLLMSEGKQVSESLSAQFAASTEHIHNFVDSNKDFFDTFGKVKDVLDGMVQYTKVQADCYKDLKSEILDLRNDYRSAQQESVNVQNAILDALGAMTSAIEKIKWL